MTAELNVYKRWDFSIASGQGCTIKDTEGREYLDLYAGHAVAITGHCHPRVVAALKAQCDKLLFYSNLVDLENRMKLAEKLAAKVPGAHSVFFVNSGSEANEAALTLARLLTGRRKVLSFSDGFHGRTLGVLSACGLLSHRARTVMGGRPLAPDYALVPWGELEALEAALGDEVAAVIAEPVQGLAGAVHPPGDFWPQAAELCRAAGAYLVFDEVQTGMGRLGAFTGSVKYKVRPDMTTLAKGLGSGFPISALLVSKAIAEQVEPGQLGSTFGGGPLACAAALTTLEVLEEEQLEANVREGERYLRSALHGIEGVRALQGAGFLLGLVLDRAAGPVLAKLRGKGILAGGSADKMVVRLTPPLNASQEDLERFVGALREILSENALETMQK